MKISALAFFCLCLLQKFPATFEEDPSKDKRSSCGDCAKCPDGFKYVPEINQCLYLNHEKKTWYKAREACAGLANGAEVVMIKNSTKQEAVRRFLELKFTGKESEVCLNSEWPRLGKLVWMGGQTKDPNQCGTPYFWKPVGAAEMPFIYTNWYPHMPNCGVKGENCAVLATGGDYKYRWEDLHCDQAACSVCEF